VGVVSFNKKNRENGAYCLELNNFDHKEDHMAFHAYKDTPFGFVLV